MRPQHDHRRCRGPAARDQGSARRALRGL